MVAGWVWWQAGCGGRLGVVAGWVWWQAGCGGRLGVVAGWVWWQAGCGGRLGWWQAGCGGRLGVVAGWVWWQAGCGGRLGVVAGWVWWQAGCGGRLGVVAGHSDQRLANRTHVILTTYTKMTSSTLCVSVKSERFEPIQLNKISYQLRANALNRYNSIKFPI